MPLDINMFRKERGGNPELVRESQRKRAADKGPEKEKEMVGLVDEIIEWDNKWRAAVEADNLARKEKGQKSKEMGNLHKEARKNKTKPDPEKLKALAAASKEGDAKIKAASETRAKALEEVRARLSQVGNIVHESVIVSNDEEKNEVTKMGGEKPDFGGRQLRHHHELLWMIGGYEPDAGTKVAGHRGYFLTGPAVRLNLALQQYGLDFLEKKDYQPVYAPFMMKKEMMAKTAQLSEFDEALYHVRGGTDAKGNTEEYYLIATSEQPISAMHFEEWMDPKTLPKRYAGLSTCFRKEAGSHGKDAWGIFRVHQFEKIEQFVYCDPEKSWEEHDTMTKIAQDFMDSLGFHYRVVNIVSGELNNAAAKKYDLEAWFPTLGRYKELVSASNCTDFQSRAMETRYGQSTDKGPGDVKNKTYVHMLNATLCATSRTICCILENYQEEDGIRIPEVLLPYMGGKTFFPFVRPPPENKTKKKQAAAKAKKNKPRGQGAP